MSPTTGIAWLPGYTMSPRVFAHVWSAMPEHRHHGLPLPGQGDDASTTDDLAARARGIARRMADVGARVLVGLSYGSCLALHTAVEHPDALDALVLAAPTLAGQEEDPAARAKYLMLAMLLSRGTPTASVTDAWMADPPPIFAGLRAHPERYAEVRADIMQHSFAELRTQSMAATRDVLHDDAFLRRLTVPTLVISGSADMPVFLDNARRLADVPAVTLAHVPGAGHLPLLERPDELGGRIADWLQAEAGPTAPAPGPLETS